MASAFSATARASASVILIICLVSPCLVPLEFSKNAWAETDDYIIVRVDGSVSKVCQLVGDWDIERNESTTSLTYTRYGVAGTDLGVSFEHNGELIFLFGDTVGRNAFPLSGKDDSFAHAADFTVDDGLNLTFYTGKPEKFLPPWVPGISQSAFEVPMEGVEVNGAAYFFFTINHTQERTMGGSILAKLDDATLNFIYLYTFSTDKFLNVHTAVVKNWLLAGLPESTARDCSFGEAANTGQVIHTWRLCLWNQLKTNQPCAISLGSLATGIQFEAKANPPRSLFSMTQ